MVTLELKVFKTTESMDFSIVIPTKNEERLLPKLLESIKRQTHKPKEMVIADDSTSHKTKKIALKYNCLITGGGSPAEGRNKGVKLVTSDLIIFFDADCFLKNPKVLELSVKRFIDKNLDIASGFALSSPENSILGHIAVYGSDFRKILDYLASKTLKTVIGGSGWYLMVKRDAFLKLNGFNENFVNYEDTDFMKRAVKRGYKFGLIPYFVFLSGRRFNKMNLRNYLTTGLYILLYKLSRTLNLRVSKKFLEKYEKVKGPLGGN